MTSLEPERKRRKQLGDGSQGFTVTLSWDKPLSQVKCVQRGNFRAPHDSATQIDSEGRVPGTPLASSLVVADPPSGTRPIPDAAGNLPAAQSRSEAQEGVGR